MLNEKLFFFFFLGQINSGSSAYKDIVSRLRYVLMTTLAVFNVCVGLLRLQTMDGGDKRSIIGELRISSNPFGGIYILPLTHWQLRRFSGVFVRLRWDQSDGSLNPAVSLA